MNKDTVFSTIFDRVTVLLLIVLVTTGTVAGSAYASPKQQQNAASIDRLASSDIIREQQRVSISFEKIPLISALQQLARKARVGISFNSDVIPNKMVTDEFKEVPVDEALHTLLEGTNLEVILPFSKDVLVIKKKERPLSKVLDVTVEGKVVSAEDGEPLAGVTIMVQGTTIGTVTDVQGNYSISVPDDGVLVFSFVGFETQEIIVDGRNEINVQLEEAVEMLDEAVVTALGLERDRQSKGYSISQINSGDLVQGTESNIANLLQGQVAGVTVTPTGGGTGSSSRVVIRGTSSLAGDNQPLYVVDGVPIDNENQSGIGFSGSAGMWGGSDGGDGIQNLNPDDIESMTVLKGASAAALYGSAAINGVIEIRTKSGKPGRVNVNFSNNTTFNVPRLNTLDLQDQYGQGSNGLRPQNQSDAWSTNASSWGERFDGQPTIQYDGVERPYENIYGDETPQHEFYETGTSVRNSLSVTGGSDIGSYYISASNLNYQGIVPKASQDRTSLTVRGQSSFGKLNVDVKANYIDDQVSNRIGVSDSPENPNYSVMQLPRNLPMSVVRNNIYNPDGSSKRLIENNIYSENPYWIINEMKDIDDKDRLIGHVNIDFQFTDWLAFNGRTGIDFSALNRTSWDGWGTPQTPEGTFDDGVVRKIKRNTDLMLTADRDLSSTVSVNAMVGGSMRYTNDETHGMAGSNYIFPDLHTISNMENSNPWYSFWEKEVRSLYGSADFSYNDYLYLNLTGRNDWSSTLPVENNSYFYPSVGTSFVFSEAFSSVLPDWLSFGQLRATWAKIGSDTNPYRLNVNYSLAGEQYDGRSYGSISGNTVPMKDLKPTMTEEIELGGDIRFFDDRLGFDFAWYDRQTINQILSANISPTSGYSSRTINAGQIDNTGMELKITGVPISRADFFWRTTINYSRNKSVVKELLEESQIMQLQTARRQYVWITAEVGEEFGTIRGTTYLRDDNGNIVHENGLPVEGPQENLGRGTPSWTSGWSNTVTYKSFSFNALIDIQWGGQIFSGTNARYYSMGLHKNTLEGRTECAEMSTSSGWPADGCYAYGGVDIDGGENTELVAPSTYFGAVSQRVAEEFVYDNNVIYVRQMQLNYSLPVEFISQFGLRNASVAAIARNPFIIYNSVPNIDPTLSLNRGNAQGLELAGVPNVRSFGVKLNLQF